RTLPHVFDARRAARVRRGTGPAQGRNDIARSSGRHGLHGLGDTPGASRSGRTTAAPVPASGRRKIPGRGRASPAGDDAGPARAEGSTVHGALCAAVAAAGAALVPGWSDAPLRVLSPIDIRGRVLNGSDHFGLCVTAAILEADGGTHDFWSRARSFSDRLKPAAGVETIAARVGLMQDLVSPISTVQQARAFLAQAFSAEILLGTLGAADLQDTYGPLTLRALWGPAVLTGFAMGQTVGAVTVGHRLHLLHSSCEPAQGLLGEVTSRLTPALRERRPARAPKPAFATGR